MGDNLSVSITADTSELRAQLALAQTDLRAFGAETKKLATDIRSGGDRKGHRGRCRTRFYRAISGEPSTRSLQPAQGAAPYLSDFHARRRIALVIDLVLIGWLWGKILRSRADHYVQAARPKAAGASCAA